MDGLTDTIERKPQSIIFPFMVPPEVREDLRRIPYQGVNNFRDLGGYATLDGRHTRWGMLYRSDRLSELTKRDLLYFHHLDVHSVVDFRSDSERQEAPDQLPQSSMINLITLPITPFDDPTITRQISERIKRGRMEGLDTRKLIIEDYRRFATTHTPLFRRYLQIVLEAAGRPVLFHCSAGKDRTGFAAAITLRLTGVSEETILYDYMLSNDYFLPAYRRQIEYMRLVHGEAAAAFALKFAEVKSEYLLTAFRAIDETYGSFERYVREGLDLREEHIAQLKEYLLE